jgi:hypothetical protein
MNILKKITIFREGDGRQGRGRGGQDTRIFFGRHPMYWAGNNSVF